MRLTKIMLGLPLLLGACGGGTATPAVSVAATPGTPYVMISSGSATPSPTPSFAGSYSGGLPAVSFLPTGSACAMGWPQSGLVLIPMVVTPQKGALQVQWPAQYGPTYRITAVDQQLVVGTQPPPTWQTVAAGSGCTVTATISGLTSGGAYIVWLDAPDSGTNIDGSRRLRSGKSGVVRPL
jgi:hypothetical protein